MHEELLLSFCIPTNGIIEWVFPVLDAIYQQGEDITKFEVVVTDNGDNAEFKEKMEQYALKHTNLIYQRNNAYLFHNQLEALKIANGKYLKFLNHRSILEEGAIAKFLSFVEENQEEKPVAYFSNGLMKTNSETLVFSDFDGFVKGLGHYASLTTGVGIWKEDFDRIPENFKYSKISPHSGVLFSERHKSKYLINDEVLMRDIDNDQSKKGKYDLFSAFGYEELSITMELLCDGDITTDTFKVVKRGYKNFLCNLYLDYCIFKEPCSYILDGFDNAMGIYFSKYEVVVGAWLRVPKKLFKRIRKKDI